MSKSKRRQPKNNKIALDTPHLQNTYDDQPWVHLVVFSTLVLGVVTASGSQPPQLLSFSTMFIHLMLARKIGGLARYQRQLRPKITTTDSLDDLRDQVAAHSREAERTYRSNATLLSILIGAELLLTFGYIYLGKSLLGGLLLITCSLLFFFRRLLPEDSAKSVLAHLGLLIATCSLLPVLGVYSQAEIVIWQTFILGFVPGTILASALLMSFALQLEQEGWNRLIPRTQTACEKNKTLRPQRTGRLGALTSALYVIGPCSAFAFATLPSVPDAIMLGAIPLLFTPRALSPFIEQQVENNVAFMTTVKISAVASAIMLLAGLLSRG